MHNSTELKFTMQNSTETIVKNTKLHRNYILQCQTPQKLKFTMQNSTGSTVYSANSKGTIVFNAKLHKKL
jgi:hypothetical protein